MSLQRVQSKPSNNKKPRPSPPPTGAAAASEGPAPKLAEPWLPESKIFTQLQRLEQRVDASFIRKNLEIQEALHNRHKEHARLRIGLFSDTDAKESNNDNPRNWTFRIVGHLLHAEREEVHPSHDAFKFSDLVKRVVVQLDSTQFPGIHSTVEWNKAFSPAVTNGFEIKRIGSRDVAATVSLYLDYAPARFKVPKPLSDMLGVETQSQAHIISVLWHYLGHHQMRNAEDPSLIELRDGLDQVFECSSISWTDLVGKLRLMLLPPDPFIIKYLIRPGVGFEDSVDVYDIKITLPETFNPSVIAPATTDKPPSYPAELSALTDQIFEKVAEIRRRERTREFLLSFVEAPVDALRLSIAANARTAERQDGRDQESERRAEHFLKDWVPDAVDRYLRQKEEEHR